MSITPSDQLLLQELRSTMTEEQAGLLDAYLNDPSAEGIVARLVSLLEKIKIADEAQ